MLNAALPPSTRPDGTQNPHVVTELQMTLDDINVIFCAVAVEVGGRFVYRERKAEENEIKIKCSHRHLCFATVDAERVLAAASPPPWTILLWLRGLATVDTAGGGESHGRITCFIGRRVVILCCGCGSR